MKRILIAVGIVVVLVILFFVWQTFLSPVILGQKGTIEIKGQKFSVDVASTDKAQEKGLSGKKSLSDKGGMLFVFPASDFHTFWMKGMLIPIDIIFIDKNTITTIYKNVAPPRTPNETSPLYRPSIPSDKALEIKAGLSDKYGIKEGDTVNISL